MDAQKTITLKFPVALPDGSTLSALTMRRPKVLDVLASSEGTADETERAVNLLANLCLVTPEAFGELDASDFAAANDAFAQLTEFTPVEVYQPGAPIPLGTPITIAGVPVSLLALRRPKVKDITAARKTGGSDAAQELALFAALAGVTVADIQSLDWADFRTIKGIYGDFLE